MELNIIGQPIPDASPTEAASALRALGVDNLADIATDDISGCAVALDEINGEAAPRCLRWFWAWCGACVACLVGGAASNAWMISWCTTVPSYKAAAATNSACFIAMGMLIVIAACWKGTIKCENAGCVWLADRVKAERERLEQEG